MCSQWIPMRGSPSFLNSSVSKFLFVLV
jgi:hypothetical protein